MLHIDPRRQEIRVTTTQSEKPAEPDGGGWALIDWRPLPLPTTAGVALVLVCAWTRDLCVRCHRPITTDRPGIPADLGGSICHDCIEDTGGPLRAAQLCPVCGTELTEPFDRLLAPYCSHKCRLTRLGTQSPDPSTATP